MGDIIEKQSFVLQVRKSRPPIKSWILPAPVKFMFKIHSFPSFVKENIQNHIIA